MSENLQTFSKLDTSKLANQYVIIINKKVFATGRDIEKILGKVKKQYPSKIPFVAKIPGEELLNLKTEVKNEIPC